MKIQRSDKRCYELTEGSERLGRIIYKGLFSFKASAIVGDASYTITPKGIFNTSISVTRDGMEVAKMKMNWKGHIFISFQNGREFVFKATGSFLTRYVLEDKDQQKIMFLNPDFIWSTFSYNYDISYDNAPPDILLVLLAAYSANYYVAAMSAAM